jgi:hypothetical protein
MLHRNRTITVAALCPVTWSLVWAIASGLYPPRAVASEGVRLKTVVAEPIQPQKNLLDNASFEQADPNGIPTGWQWDPRNTDATCVIDRSVAHSGRQSLRLTNGTAFGAHIYGMLYRPGPIRLTEGKTYTLSAWVRSDAPGVTSLVAGANWQYRAEFVKTTGQWRRVATTFTAGRDDAQFVVRINTESPTRGVWIDDVRVEEGSKPSFDPVDARDGKDLVLGIDDQTGVVQGDGAFCLPFVVRTARPVAGAWQITLSTGESLRQPVNLAAGVWRILVQGEATAAPETPCTLTVQLEPSDHKIATVRLPVQFYSNGAVQKRVAPLKKQLATSRQDLNRLRSRGQDVSYPDVTFTVLENFVGFVEEDGRGGEIKRALEQLDDLEKMAVRLRTELDAALAGQRPLAGVPRWTGSQRPVVKSSSFIAPVRMPDGKVVERPVFFYGYGHFGRVVADMERWPHYGTNIIQIEFGPNGVFPAEGQTNDAPMRNMLGILDRAQKAGVGVCLLISPHYFPPWALAKWPHLRKQNTGFLQYCLHAPEGQELLHRFVVAAIAPLKDHPALHSICLSNEPVNQEGPCEPAKKLWQKWLRTRYGDVATFNARHGSKLASLSNVAQPDSHNPPADRALWLDYLRFNQEFFADWHRMLADAVHEVAPQLPVHVKAMNHTMLGASSVQYGVDATLFGRLSNINGNDAVNYYNFGDTEFAQGWLANAMGHDLQRSVLDAPVFNSENHIIADREARRVPAGHIRAALWQAAIHGQSATTVWVWERTSDMKSDLAGSIMLRPACAEAVGLVNLDLNRAALEVTAIQQSRPQALLLHSVTASMWEPQSFDRCLQNVYTALSFTGLKLGFVTERQLEAGVVPEAPALFIPGVQHLSDAALAGLRKFRGRLVFVGDGEPLGHDEYGRPRRPDLPIDKLAADNTSARKLCELLATKLPEWNVRPTVELREAGRPIVWGVEWRSAETPRGTVVNLCNYRKEPVTIALTRANQTVSARDVLTGQPVNGSVTLQPLEVRLLRLERQSTGQPSIAWDANRGQAVLTNGSLKLVIETRLGLNPRSLCDVKSGRVYADRDYVWSGGGLPKMESTPVIADSGEGNRSIAFRGRLGSIAVEQVFTVPKNEPGVILERVTIGNPTDKPIETAGFHCGFAKHLREGATWAADALETRFCRMPYRRETDGQMQEFLLREVAEHGTTFSSWFNWPPQTTPIWGSEGWVWHQGPTSLLIAKHNAEGMEWSLMEPVKRGATETVLRFGGAGQWKYGHPEGATRLGPGKSYQFGETRFQAIGGDWKQAFYAFRGYMDEKGHRRPKDYNPPVHWNELYDNEYFFKNCAELGPYFQPGKPGFCPALYAKNQELLEKYYTLDLMKAEAAKAKEIGCEALYLDPGWYMNGPDLQVWDAARLGPMDAFVNMVRSEYGLKGVSLWCSLGGVPPTYCDPAACPLAQVLTKDGKKADLLTCFPTPGFLDIKEKRLLELCRNGAMFLMFDSDQYSGPCYDKTHGHAVPSTREEHAKALFELARRVKAKYPHVLIEMHDPITGPGGVHYTPTYFGYQPPQSFDCLWGHEFMWNSMDDLVSGRAVSLYYYNLAYSIPIYLHVSLKPDNANALVFWWFASTCRHLGMGGKSPDPAVWAAHKKAMQTYLPLKRFYTQGEFYGLDETVHVHTLPELRQAVINVFNLTDKPAERQIRFRLADVGLLSGSVKIEGAAFQQNGAEITIDVAIAARGHLLLKAQAAANQP